MHRAGVRRGLLLFVSDDALRGQKQACHRSRVLQRTANDLGRVHNASLHQVLELLTRRIKAEGPLLFLDGSIVEESFEEIL